MINIYNLFAPETTWDDPKKELTTPPRGSAKDDDRPRPVRANLARDPHRNPFDLLECIQKPDPQHILELSEIKVSVVMYPEPKYHALPDASQVTQVS